MVSPSASLILSSVLYSAYAIELAVFSTAQGDFVANPAVGPAETDYKGTPFVDSPRFRFYNFTDDVAASTAFENFEAAYDCFVTGFGFGSPSLSISNTTDKTNYKTNIYSNETMGGGVMSSSATWGLAFATVCGQSMTDPATTIHEYGHILTYASKTWNNQINTGIWWETLAQWIADTFMTSPLCEPWKTPYKLKYDQTIINLNTVISNSSKVIVDGSPDNGNMYEAWPFFTYLVNNPDHIPGLGWTVIRELFRQYSPNSDETPLHTLQRIIAPYPVQKVVARYWARMAYVDIGHDQAQEQFAAQQSTFDYTSWDKTSDVTWRVKPAKRPFYMGANIAPLSVPVRQNTVTVCITTTVPLTATFAVRNPESNAVRYYEFAETCGAGSCCNIEVPWSEEVSVVIVNTPAELVMYDPSDIAAAGLVGADYEMRIDWRSN